MRLCRLAAEACCSSANALSKCRRVRLRSTRGSVQVFLITDPKFLKTLRLRRSLPLENRVQSVEGQRFLDWRIANGESNDETMGAHSMSLQCSKRTGVLRTVMP